MTTPLIRWHDEPQKLEADPAATVAVSKEEWEKAGARFVEVDDGQGETPALATGIATTSAGELRFGVLDYSDGTYLLVPGDAEHRERAMFALLGALHEAGIVDSDEQVLDVARAEPLSLEERVAELERQLGERTRAASPSSKAASTNAFADSVAAAWAGRPFDLDMTRYYGFATFDQLTLDEMIRHHLQKDPFARQSRPKLQMRIEKGGYTAKVYRRVGPDLHSLDPSPAQPESAEPQPGSRRPRRRDEP